MEKFLDLISEEMQSAFGAAGYDETLGKVTLSNRPDLCEYQCNGALAVAKEYHKAPIMIADSVVEALESSELYCPGSSQLHNQGKISIKGETVALTMGHCV